MITEDYCSYEIAKLLKDKGFDEPCNKCYYVKDEEQKPEEVHNGCNSDLANNFISCPTTQMALNWLREKHNIHADIGYDDLDWFWNIISISEKVPVEDRPKFIKEGTACYKTYEEAVEAALKYVLENLI